MIDKKNGPRTCECCETVLIRKRYGRRLEDRRVFERRKFCGTACANARSPAAKQLRRESVKNQPETRSDSSTTAERKTAIEILEEAANNKSLDWTTRINAAKALAPYQGKRASAAVGKKVEQQGAAQTVASGRFGTSKAPTIVPIKKQGF